MDKIKQEIEKIERTLELDLPAPLRANIEQRLSKLKEKLGDEPAPKKTVKMATTTKAYNELAEYMVDNELSLHDNTQLNYATQNISQPSQLRLKKLIHDLGMNIVFIELKKVIAKKADKKQSQSKPTKKTKEELLAEDVNEYLSKNDLKNVAFKVSKVSNKSYQIEPHSYKGNGLDGMIINLENGIYEVAENQAGAKQDEMWIYGEYKSLSRALTSILKGNSELGRTPVKFWDNDTKVKGAKPWKDHPTQKKSSASMKDKIMHSKGGTRYVERVGVIEAGTPKFIIGDKVTLLEDVSAQDILDNKKRYVKVKNDRTGKTHEIYMANLSRKKPSLPVPKKTTQKKSKSPAKKKALVGVIRYADGTYRVTLDKQQGKLPHTYRDVFTDLKKAKAYAKKITMIHKGEFIGVDTTAWDISQKAKKPAPKKKSTVAQKKASVKKEITVTKKNIVDFIKKHKSLSPAKFEDKMSEFLTKEVYGRLKDSTINNLVALPSGNKSLTRSEMLSYIQTRLSGRGQSSEYSAKSFKDEMIKMLERDSVPAKKRSSVSQKKASVKKKSTPKKQAPKRSSKDDKIKSIKKRFPEQTKGRSNRSISQDLKTKAKPAGRRVSEDGNVYYEYRPSKSDSDRRSKI